MERKTKNWRTSLAFLAVLWIVLLIASVTILSSVIAPFLRTLQTQNLVSGYWSGYSVSSNLLFRQPSVTSVSGSWTVPSVAVSAGNTFSASWIGIGGQGEVTIIQVGSEHNSIDGEERYGLWYEMLPDNAISIPEITVLPGDKIHASISLVDSNANKWLIEISDVSNGQRFTQNFVYNSSRLTAEWIVERPTVNNQVTTLADFRSITFSEIEATIDGRTGNLNSFPSSVIFMQDNRNRDLVTISPFGEDGSSFTVTYR